MPVTRSPSTRPRRVAWLQLYVDMVKAGTVDNTALTTQDDRVGLLIFSAGQSAFYATGPNLIREVKANNETLYNDLAVAPSPVGKSGVLGKGLMAMSVKADTAFPNASLALAQYFTNPRAMVEFAKQVAVYPSSDAAYDDPFFSETPEAIEDSARPVARETISKYADIVPTVPKKADVNEIVQQDDRGGPVRGQARAAGPQRGRPGGQRAHRLAGSVPPVRTEHGAPSLPPGGGAPPLPRP